MQMPVMTSDVNALAVPEFNDEMYRDVLSGLRADPPEIPAKYLYDDRGSRLFNQICDLDEYYLTDTEIELTKSHVDDIAARIGSRARLVELGAGSGLKTRILLEHLHDLAAYVPVDISTEELKRCARRLSEEYPDVDIHPVSADYTDSWTLPRNGFEGRTVFYYPGSTVGNFHPEQSRQFLRRMARLAGPRGAMVIGVDLHKDRDVLEAAYNDSQGVTAEFTLNLLRRINRECGADFQLEDFRHQAIYQEDQHRIQVRLCSQCDQQVNFPDATFQFDDGDWIVAEYSYKYTIEGFAQLAEQANWRTRAIWTDDDQLFSLWYLEVDPEAE